MELSALLLEDQYRTVVTSRARDHMSTSGEWRVESGGSEQASETRPGSETTVSVSETQDMLAVRLLPERPGQQECFSKYQTLNIYK